MRYYFILSICLCLFASCSAAYPEYAVHKQSILTSKQFYPHFDTLNNRFLLRNQQTKFGKKFLLGSVEVVSYNLLSTALLFALPKDVSKWYVLGRNSVNNQYRKSFTSPPVYDDDVWYINYLGHPYQGSCYYNSVRSQGATFWQAGLFAFGHSIFWEYIAEGGLEQPSIQDLVVTPFVGSILGELTHHATIIMSRNGFKWYEKIFVCIFNPIFAINNGFRYAEFQRARLSKL